MSRYTEPVTSEGSIETLLASSPVFEEVNKNQLGEIARLLRVTRHPAGAIILRQGGYSSAVYFLLSGRLAVRIHRDSSRETVAWMQPPDLFGELSYVTGRPCVADVEVVVDAEVAALTKEALPKDPMLYEAVLRGLTRLIAERLQVTMVAGAKAPPAPVVLLHCDPLWTAPTSFPAELTKSLAAETGKPTLLVRLGPEPATDVRRLDNVATVCQLQTGATDQDLRPRIATKLTEWAAAFPNLILIPSGPDTSSIARTIAEFTNCDGFLLGGGSDYPLAAEDTHFVVQDDRKPNLPLLDGRRQLIGDVADSEKAYLTGKPVTARFKRTVDSIARFIAGTQVGLALGGGAAWGWAHIGVLEVFEEGGIPIDMVAGCSMGSLVGALYAMGKSVAELQAIAEYWRNRKARFIEWRIWKFCLLNERVVYKTFLDYFHQEKVNETRIPYWANAVDIQIGKEFTMSDGLLADCVRGSIGLPGLLPPFPRGPRLLVDSGIMNPVPVSLVRSMGANFAIGVNAMVPPGAQKVRHRYPLNMVEIMTRCMFVMGHEIGEAAAEKSADIVFTPDLTNLSMLHFGRSAEIIEAGREIACKNLPAIRALYARLKTTG
jgi:NTE family protein